MSKGSKEGFDKWLKTGSGKKCLAGFLMNQPDEYKRNCLWWTYQAGAASDEISMTREIASILEDLSGRKTIPVGLQKRIEYVLKNKSEYTTEAV